jgi:hypothetical protein
MYSFTVSLTSALDVDEWSTPHPGHFNTGKDQVPFVKEAGWATEPVWMGVEKSHYHWDSIPRLHPTASRYTN